MSVDPQEKDNEMSSVEASQMAYNKDLEDQAQELRALGISVVDQISLEENVEAAVDEAVAKHSRKQKSQILKKEVKESSLEIMKIRKKEETLQQKLKDMQQRFTDPRQYLATERCLKENKEQLKLLQERKNYIEEKLKESNENESVLDEVDLNLEEGELIDVDDEIASESNQNVQFDREKMIQEGKMTPFGTILNHSETNERFFQGSSHDKVAERKPISFRREKYEEDEATSVSHKAAVIKTSADSKVANKSCRVTSGLSEFDRYLQDQIDKQKSHSSTPSFKSGKRKVGDCLYGNFKKRKRKPKEFISPVPTTSSDDPVNTVSEVKKKSPLKRNILHPKRHWKEKNLGSFASESEVDQHKVPRRLLSERLPFLDDDDNGDERDQSDSDYVPSADEEEQDDDDKEMVEGRKMSQGKSQFNKEKAAKYSKDSTCPALETKKSCRTSKKVIRKTKDDGHVEEYVKRIRMWRQERLKEKQRKIVEGEDDLESEDEENLYESFEGGLKVPLSIWNKLYKYQRTCVKWLWELHIQKCGGILGDEMGLGKTIMIISFLIGLSYSGLIDRAHKRKGLGPVLIIAPATVLHQWVKEFHSWWPPFRVAVLHDSGSFVGKKSALIHNINNHGGILITSYRGAIDHLKVLLNYDWHYVILDEGHKIRNPDAQITVAVKRFQTPHRLILSGSPIQNSLKELWSLFDFIFPGKLGTLPVFMEQFAVPITQGGYANATKLEVQTAFRCATVLRDTINPYLLRRMKKDVRSHLTLPDKNEQVLFCGLTDDQRTCYREYLDGNEVKSILGGRFQVFVGLINLRKICNHPDLYNGGPRLFEGEEISGLQPELQYGWWKRAGKMVVLHSILKLWKKQEHRVLLFTQSKQMMCVLEKYLQDEKYTYVKMDGTTSVSSRQPLIQRFNEDPSIFIFLLTTRVGGLGVNLTGADRVVLYDPDWNPSTDTQARERAWRIGQKRHVTIYRLVTAGTIEEKIYHRQIFKQFLTNRVLKDPKQQRFFKTNDLYELFTLNEGVKEKTESSAIFAGTGSEIEIASKRSPKTKEKTDKEMVISKNHCSRPDSKTPSAKERETAVKPERRDYVGILKKKADSEKARNGESLTKTECFSMQMQLENVELCEDNDTKERCNSAVLNNFHEPCFPEGSEDTNQEKRLSSPGHLETSSKNCDEEIRESVSNTENRQEDQLVANTETSLVKYSEKKKVYEENDEKTKRMRELAKLLSKKIAEKKEGNKEVSPSIEKEHKRKKKKDKHKKKEKVGKKLEGERIDNLVKRRRYKYAADDDPDEGRENQHEMNKSQDDFVLRKLFKKSGVHTALSHDAIINSGDPDYLLLESEASRVANEALKKVRLSRARCLQVSAGSNSVAVKKKTFGNKKSQFLDEDKTKNAKKRPGQSKSGRRSPAMFNGGIEDENDSPCEENTADPPSSGANSSNYSGEGATSGVLSSAQLLKKMRERKRCLNDSAADERGNSTTAVQHNPRLIDPYGPITYDPNYPSTADPDNPEVPLDDPEVEEHVELLTDIRNFVAFQSGVDGQASTQEILQRFSERLPPSRNHIFKALLNNICDFVRNSLGQGIWYLKSEFR